MMQLVTSVYPDFHLYVVVKEKVKEIELQLAVLKQMLWDIEYKQKEE